MMFLSEDKARGAHQGGPEADSEQEGKGAPPPRADVLDVEAKALAEELFTHVCDSKN
jgi:hypothetical protein